MQYLRTGGRLKAATESSSHALDTCWWAQLLLQPSSSDSLLAGAASLNTSGCRVSESCCLLALQNSAGCLLMGRPTGGRDRRVAPAALASAARSAWACRLLFMYSCTRFYMRYNSKQASRPTAWWPAGQHSSSLGRTAWPIRRRPDWMTASVPHRAQCSHAGAPGWPRFCGHCCRPVPREVPQALTLQHCRQHLQRGKA